MEETDQLEEKLVLCETMIQSNPTNISAFLDKGWTLRKLKRYEEALATF